MLEMLEKILGETLLMVWIYCLVRFLKKRLYRSANLLLYTPAHDEENVLKKHDKMWKNIRKVCFFPLILIAAEIVFYILGIDAITESYGKIRTTIMFTTIIASLPSLIHIERNGFSQFYLLRYGDDGTYPFVIGRYMVYPAKVYSSACVTAVTLSAVAILVSIFSALFPNEYLILRSGIKTPTHIKIFEALLSLAVLFFSNYIIIYWFEKTPREHVLNEAIEENYDRAAKRYYGIWRNRLIAANVVAGAQLILGGFVTLTNAGDSLMGIRILGLVILAVVFTYILIQSRDFEDPVVVKGMVYPSERKRVLMQKIILSAIVLYILGAVILL